MEGKALLPQKSPAHCLGVDAMLPANLLFTVGRIGVAQIWRGPTATSYHKVSAATTCWERGQSGARMVQILHTARPAAST